MRIIDVVDQVRLNLLCSNPYLLNLEYKPFPRAVQRRLFQTLTMMIPAFSKEEGCYMENLRYLHQSHWHPHRYHFFRNIRLGLGSEFANAFDFFALDFHHIN